MDQVYAWVKNIVVFLLLIILIDQLMPSSNYKKYIKVSVGLVMILLVFTPVLDLLNKGDVMDYNFELKKFKISSQDLEFDPDLAGEQRKELIVSQYKDTLSGQIKQLINDEAFGIIAVEVEINDDYDSEEFGSIHTIYITLTQAEAAKDLTDIEIDEITVKGSDQSVENEESLSDHKKNEISLELKSILNRYYSVEMNNIVVIFE